MNGKFEPEAQAVIERLASYTELSPSGTGIHVLVKAKLSGPGRRSSKVEIYDSRRYFTITGHQLSHTADSIANRQLQLDQLLSEIFASGESMPTVANPANLFVSDEDLIERAKGAKNGQRFSRLWCGDLSDFGGDHSRADLALCRMLLFWCKGDFDRVDRLFRQSGLMRNKWDRPCGAMRYGERTIATLRSEGE